MERGCVLKKRRSVYMELTWKTLINFCGRIMHSWIPSGQSPGLHSSMLAFKQRLGGSLWLRGDSLYLVHNAHKSSCALKSAPNSNCLSSWFVRSEFSNGNFHWCLRFFFFLLWPLIRNAFPLWWALTYINGMDVMDVLHSLGYVLIYFPLEEGVDFKQYSWLCDC